jgi:hypothetical protein
MGALIVFLVILAVVLEVLVVVPRILSITLWVWTNLATLKLLLSFMALEELSVVVVLLLSVLVLLVALVRSVVVVVVLATASSPAGSAPSRVIATPWRVISLGFVGTIPLEMSNLIT